MSCCKPTTVQRVHLGLPYKLLGKRCNIIGRGDYNNGKMTWLDLFLFVVSACIILSAFFVVVDCAVFAISSAWRALRTASRTVPTASAERDPEEAQAEEAQANWKEKEDPDACPVCLDPLESTSSVAELYCGHKFCVPCIAKWEARASACPLCRSVMGPRREVHSVV